MDHVESIGDSGVVRASPRWTTDAVRPMVDGKCTITSHVLAGGLVKEITKPISSNEKAFFKVGILVIILTYFPVPGAVPHFHFICRGVRLEATSKPFATWTYLNWMHLPWIRPVSTPMRAKKRMKIRAATTGKSRRRQRSIPSQVLYISVSR